MINEGRKVVCASGLELIRFSPSERICVGDVIHIDGVRGELVYKCSEYRKKDYDQERLPIEFSTISQSERDGRPAILYKIYNLLLSSCDIEGLGIGICIPEGLYLRFKSERNLEGDMYGWLIDGSEDRKMKLEALKDAGLWEDKKQLQLFKAGV